MANPATALDQLVTQAATATATATVPAMAPASAPAAAPSGDAAEIKYAAAENFADEHIFAPAFFRKLAELGVEPATEEVGLRLWHIGQMVREGRRQYLAKQAESRINQLDKVAQDIGRRLEHNYGLVLTQPGPGDDRLRKEAAALAEVPDWLQSVQTIYETIARQSA